MTLSASLFGVELPVKLIANGDGTYAIAVKSLSANAAASSGDLAISAGGINIPIRYVNNGDGTYSLAVCTSRTGAPTVCASLFGQSRPVCLVGLSSAYGVFVKSVTSSYAPTPSDYAASVFGVNVPLLFASNGDGTFALGIATPVTPKPAADQAISSQGINYPIRYVALASQGVYALGTVLQ